MLSAAERRRYARHLSLPEVGLEGQERLRAGSVLLVGAGGLGSPAALYLAAAGVGRIGLVDFDRVDESNLQRQVLHDTAFVGRPKLESAQARLGGLNPHVSIEAHPTAFDRANALDLVARYDVVLDGTDTFATRYLTNDACFLLGKPNVYGSVFRFEGQCSVFWPGRGPCYRCLYPQPPPPGLVPSCSEGGVLGILPGVIGLLQATEALKILLGIGEALVGRLLLYDALALDFTELQIRRQATCPLCGDRPTIRELQDYEALCGAPALSVDSITARELRDRLARGEPLQVLDVREPHEWDIVHLPQALLLPLGSMEDRVHELDPGQTYVVHCKGGVRSRQAIARLRAAGLHRLLDLEGGILAWVRDVDPSLPGY